MQELAQELALVGEELLVRSSRKARTSSERRWVAGYTAWIEPRGETVPQRTSRSRPDSRCGAYMGGGEVEGAGGLVQELGAEPLLELGDLEDFYHAGRALQSASGPGPM